MFWSPKSHRTGREQTVRRGRAIRRRRAFVELLESRRLLAAIRIATYNVENSPSGPSEDADFSTIFQGIGNQTQAGITRPVDLLVLQETDSVSANRIEAILDSLYADDYSRIVGPSYFGDSYAFVYNTATLSFLSSTNVGNTSTFTRPPLRGHFEPIGATSNDADFYIYSTHLKADSFSTSFASTRAQEANSLRADADALGDGENVLVVGDFNMKSSFEGAFSNFTSAGNGQLFDPVNQLGNWFNNSAFKSVHTQDPSGGGGMDDRFDLQFVSGELQTTGGLEYINGSYRVYGNNGTHALNGLITSGNAETATIRSALAGASDHLPVVVDYEFQTVPPGVTISESDGNTIVAENSYLDSYSLVLDTVPDENVTVTLTPDSQIDIGAGAGNAITRVFTPGTALTPQTISVTAVDDLISEGNHVSPIVHSFSSSDSDYDSLADINVNVIVVDNESPTILINEVDAVPTGDLEFVELYDGGIGNTSLNGKAVVFYDGGTDTSYAAFDLDGFTTDDNGLFVLGNASVPGVDLSFSNGLLRDGADAVAIYDADATSFPNGTNVTLTNLVDALVYDTDDADDSGLATLLLAGQPQINENQNGNQANESNSRIPDGGLARTTTSFDSTVPTPDELNTPRPVGLTIIGNDSIDVTEGGATDSYSIALTSVPTANVVITIDPDADLDLGAGQGTPIDLTFTPANAMSPQTITVTAFDDLLAEGLHGGLITHSISSADSNYNPLTIDDIIANITDDEPAPPPAMVISEIMYNPASSGEGTAFTPEWVELVNLATAPQDISGWKLADEDGDIGTIPASTIVQPGQVIVLFDGDPSAITTEAGFRTTWNVPAGALVVGIDWSEELDNDPTTIEGVLQLKDPLDFVQDTVNYDDDDPTPTSWPSDSPEGPSIYLTNLLADNNVGSNWARSAVGVDDGVAANGFPFSTADVGSPGNAPAVTLANLIVTESAGSTDVTEGGNDDDFTIVLDSTPTDDVLVTITPDSQLDLGAGAGVAMMHTFTMATALTPFTIDVDAENDQVAEGIHSGSISFTTASNDVAFNALVVTDLTVNVTDNDTAGITISETGGSTDVTEGGATDSFTVVLDTIPTDTVTVTITPDAQLDLGSGQGVAVTRQFTSVDALTPKSVTVTAFDDSIVESAHSGNVTFSVSSNDSFYDGLSVADLTANITDNDGSVATVSLAGNSLPYTGPGTYSFDISITADTQALDIVGFTIPMLRLAGVNTLVDPPPPGGSISDILFTPHPSLETKGASSDFGSVGFSITAVDADASPLSLSMGQTETLFSISVDLGTGFVVGDTLTLVPPALEPLFEITTTSGSLDIGNGGATIGAAASVFDVAPTVTDVKVAGSLWSSGSGGLFDFLEAVDPGQGLGYSIFSAPSVLPWTNIDTIYVEFSEDIGSFDNLDFSLGGVPVAPPPLGGPIGDYEAAGLIPSGNVSYDAINARATIQLTSAFTADKLVLTLFAATIDDGAGNQLDGNGDGTDGDDFVQFFEVLPGDSLGGGAVTSSDVDNVLGSTGQVAGLGAFEPFADLNGNGAVNSDDYNAALSRTGTLLPLNSPLAPPAARASNQSTLSSLMFLFEDDEDEIKSWEFRVDQLFNDLQAI